MAIDYEKLGIDTFEQITNKYTANYSPYERKIST